MLKKSKLSQKNKIAWIFEKHVTVNGFIFTTGNSLLYKRWNQVKGRAQKNTNGKTNSCEVAIGFYVSKTVEQTNKISDKSGGNFLVEAIDDPVFALEYWTNTCKFKIEKITYSKL